MNNENKNNSSLPFIIISLVLIGVAAGGWWFYQSSKNTKTTKTNTNKSNTNLAVPVTSNLPGAQPPNMLGSPNALVTIEEFADFQCPTCASVHAKMKEITALYGNRIKFVYRNFPLTQIHKNAYDAAVAAESAGLQGKYWEMQNQLFTNQTAWANSADARKIFGEYAQKIGLDVDRFQTDMLGLAAKSRVDLDIARGRAMGINGTPSIFINGRQLSFEQFDVTPMRQVIDAELQKAQSGAQTGNQSQTNSLNQSNNPNPTNSGNVSATNANAEKK